MLGILELYLANRMKMGGETATTIQHLFGTAVYFLPLAGGWLADRWLGRYWTILTISLFYCLGHGVLAFSEGSRTGLYAGLALIAIGAGGIKPCVSAFVGDQFKPSQHHLLTNIYGWFYWAINLGAAAAFFIIPLIHVHWGYAWAFGVPGLAMGVATFVFWLGRRQYVRQPTARESKRAPAEVKADRKSLLRIALVFLPVPMFWALYNQTNSTWVLQGAKMTPFYYLNGETMQVAGAVLVMMWTPALTLALYPMAGRLGWRPTALRRMTAGMFFAAMSFVICGLVQARMDQGQTMSILWQLAAYVVLEVGRSLVVGHRPGICLRAGAGPAQERGDEFMDDDHRHRPFHGRRLHPVEPALCPCRGRFAVLFFRGHDDRGDGGFRLLRRALPPRVRGRPGPMNTPPVIHPLSSAETRDLARAKLLLERPGLAMRLANFVGSPLEKGFALLPKKWNKAINKAAQAALLKALDAAVATLGRRQGPGARESFHKMLAGTSGAIGGVFGLAALPVELPISTVIMLRSIAEVARGEGHDLSSIETKLACVEVFALGGREAGVEEAPSAYWATRAAMSQTLSEAASYLARKGAVRESAPAIARFVSQIAARFGALVSEEAAAKAVPVLGAAGGGIINVLFISHFQDMARGHFIVKRLEAGHGREQIRAAYEQLALPQL
jgi:MFS family permease